MRGLRIGIGIGIVATALAACAPAYNEAAWNSFSLAYACPIDRITYYDEPPPADIARDPERKAIWERTSHSYVVDGCGHEQHYVCNDASDSTGTTVASCHAALP